MEPIFTPIFLDFSMLKLIQEEFLELYLTRMIVLFKFVGAMMTPSTPLMAEVLLKIGNLIHIEIEQAQLALLIQVINGVFINYKLIYQMILKVLGKPFILFQLKLLKRILLHSPRVWDVQWR